MKHDQSASLWSYSLNKGKDKNKERRLNINNVCKTRLKTEGGSLDLIRSESGTTHHNQKVAAAQRAWHRLPIKAKEREEEVAVEFENSRCGTLRIDHQTMLSFTEVFTYLFFVES